MKVVLVVKEVGCKEKQAPVGRGAQNTIPLVSKGDQRDEEEETQMKKSESEVEVSTVGGPGI